MIIKIENDLFDISSRIKKINNNYFIVFNRFTDKYEVHNSKNKSGSYCLSLGKFLNAKGLTEVYKSQSKNLTEILHKMNSENEKLESKVLNKTNEGAKERLTEFLRFADKKSCDLNFDNL